MRNGILQVCFFRNNFIIGNYLGNNHNAITLLNSNDHNTISKNNITTNHIGIWFRNASNNIIYNNNFINNTLQVLDFGAKLIPSSNTWDDGLNYGGNFWSDYQGFDADGDGIGDEPYIIDSENVDSYPLMYPYDIEKGTIISPTPEAHPEPEDLPITPVIASAIIVAVVSVGLLVYFKKRKH